MNTPMFEYLKVKKLSVLDPVWGRNGNCPTLNTPLTGIFYTYSPAGQLLRVPEEYAALHVRLLQPPPVDNSGKLKV